jgi:tetratricopeptide (TPR) repeat protein
MSFHGLSRERRSVSALLCFLGILSGCGSSETSGPSTKVVLARDRAADLGARARWSEARAVLEPLVAAADAAPEDLLRAACADLAATEALDHVDRIGALLDRASAAVPDDPRLTWCRYRLAALSYDKPREVELLRRLRALRPEDSTVLLTLASALDDLDEPETETEALALYREFLALPPEDTGSWRMTALYRLGQALIRMGQESEAEPLFAESRTLEARGLTRPGVPAHEPGTLGAIPPHTPGVLERPEPSTDVGRYDASDLPGEVAGGAAGQQVAQIAFEGLEDVAETYAADREELYAFTPRPAIVSFGERGVFLGSLDASERLREEPVIDLIPLDRANVGATKGSDADPRSGDQDLDFLFVDSAGHLRWLENVAGEWHPGTNVLAELPDVDGPGRLLAVDSDHDGDLDLVACGPNGPRLLRNDGLDGSGVLTDVTGESGLPPGDWTPLAEDMDRDNDVDLLFLPRDGGAPALASNERGGRFSNATSTLPDGLRGRWFVAADLDGDSWPDLAAADEQEVRLFLRTELGGWRSEPRRIALRAPVSGPPSAVDLDLDGTFDLAWPTPGAPAAALLAPGLAKGGIEVTLGEGAPVAGPAMLTFADLDGDGDLDLVRSSPSGTRAYLKEGVGNGITLALRGHKDNARGVGAIVELRAGTAYRRLYFRGAPECVGFGGAPLDVVRVTWPNGVVQGNFGLQPGARLAIAQRVGLIGSCPFLYTWNGTTYTFVSDVLGITPLGLPMAPGMLVPPDHDEYVLVRGDQLVPRDGVYEIQLTEELREVTYLDHLRLDVVDHPEDVEVFPDERFTFPPFPRPHTHTVRKPLAPLAARDANGRDWSAELARDDGLLARPFQPLAGPYTGLAEPHTLELSFDPARVAAAPRLRLFLNGWFYWSDASVNMAVARHPDHAFVPPLLAVPDGEGGWRECGPIGFPAGKLKTMVVDATELLNRADPRLRLTSTLCLAWDSIRLAVDGDDAALVTTPLAPVSARLWERGFSRSVRPIDGFDGEWFEWDALEPLPRWNQHPGLYTRLGETESLLRASDDRFVILGSGDALTVRFDASKAPPLPDGWQRDYLLYLDGWAKDRDPNTLEALFVEPLPFHGMSGYPYGPNEHFPDDEAHRAYRREWNTRPARRWIDPLVQ